MDIVNHTVLAWLEEDNQKLGHFRVRPLLRETGPFTPAEIGEWRDDGFIRVVPDKSEQRSFKERMRALGSFCLLTLTGQLADKFKNNKNYAPSKGEKNRYIVYSRAVAAITDGLFYEVVQESALKKAVTAQAYARLGGKIRGPVERMTGVDLDGATQLPPDDPRIFSVTLPDGTVRLFYWPQPVEAATEEPVSATEPEETAPAAEMTALDQIRALDQQMLRLVQNTEDPDRPQKPKTVIIPDDAGTPLYQAQVEMEQQKRRRNTLAEAVESSRKTERKADPPADPPAEKKKSAKKAKEAASRQKADKDEDFSATLASAWTDERARAGLIERLLSLPGSRELVAKALGGADDPVLASLKAQLQDTEAERLMTVMNMNRAKEQEAAFRDSLIAGLVNSERQEIDRLQAEAEKAAEVLKTLKAQQAELLAEQERIARGLELPVAWPSEAAQEPALSTVVHRLAECLSTAGFRCTANDAAALLLVCALDGSVGVSLCAQCGADSRAAAQALSAACGGTLADESPDLRILKGGAAPLLLIRETAGACRPGLDSCVNLYLRADPAMPVVTLCQGDALPRPVTRCPAVSWSHLAGQAEALRTPLSEAAEQVIRQLRSLCAAEGVVLPLCLVAGMLRFMEAAQNILEGGITAALDYGMLMYAVPAIERGGNAFGYLSELTRALPLTRTRLRIAP